MKFILNSGNKPLQCANIYNLHILTRISSLSLAALICNWKINCDIQIHVNGGFTIKR